MTFIWPAMLVWLMLVPAFIAVYLWMQQRRRGLAAVFGNPALVRHSTGASKAGRPGVRRHVPPLFFLLALVILILALARPQAVVSMPRLQGTIILTFDVSGSMAADDMEPTRLEAAKAAAIAFVQRQPSTVRIGVVSFSDAGFSMQAPTDDQAAILAAINRLTVQRGTSLARGIEASLNAIAATPGGHPNPALTLADSAGTPTATPTPVPPGTYMSAVIVMLTDGENNQEPDPLQAAQIAADRGVRVYTVGIGSAEGAVLNIEGLTVRSRLDEPTLRQISEMTGGAYYNAQSEEELSAIYGNLSPQLLIKPQEIEVTSLFAGASILVLMIGSALSLLWLGRLP